MLGAPGYLGKLQQHSAGAQYFACSKLRPRRERVQSITCQYLLPGSPLQPLHQLINSSHLQELVLRHPELLTAEHSSPVTSWLDFWHEYGLDENAIGKLLLQCPELISCTSIYEAGRTLLFFRHLGWKHEHIRGRIIAQYPQVLAKQLERDIQPVIHELMVLGCTPPDIKLLVWEYPRIFTAGKDYRRHIRKFQFLELYGLKLPGCSSNNSSRHEHSSGSDSGSDSDVCCSRGARDSLEWLLLMVQN